MKSGWASCFACLALCAACIPPRLTASDAAAAADTSPPETPTDIAGGERPMGGRLVLKVTADENDALWIDGTDERLHYSSMNLTLEVGTDGEMGRTGLRFQLTVPPGSIITSAKIGLRSENTHTDSASTMTVQIYDSVNVPPFSELHDHPPEKHDPGQLMGHSVNGFVVCETGQVCASPDVAELVQRVVDKSEWTGTGWIGFVLAPDDFASSSWISFDDSSAGTVQPSLELEYAPRP